MLGCRECYNLTYRSCQTEDKRVYQLARTPELLEWALRYKDFRWQRAASGAITLLRRRAQRKRGAIGSSQNTQGVQAWNC